MKQTIYYDEMCVPKQIRIVSEKLCLDHTFTVGAAKTFIGYDDIIELMQSRLVDRIYICFDEGSAYISDVDGSLLSIQGWYQIRSSQVELKKISEYNYTLPHSEKAMGRRGVSL